MSQDFVWDGRKIYLSALQETSGLALCSELVLWASLYLERHAVADAGKRSCSTIDGQVCWKSNGRFTFCRPRKNNLLFSVSACSKQTEVCRFHFLFAGNKWNLLFPCLIFLLYKTQTTYPIPTLSHVHTQHSKQFIHSTLWKPCTHVYTPHQATYIPQTG